MRTASRKQTAKKKTEPESSSPLEIRYTQMFGEPSDVVIVVGSDQPLDLRQPSPLKVVESVTTYGAYEDPI